MAPWLNVSTLIGDDILVKARAGSLPWLRLMGANLDGFSTGFYLLEDVTLVLATRAVLKDCFFF